MAERAGAGPGADDASSQGARQGDGGDGRPLAAHETPADQAPVLRGERVVLRPLTDADIPALVRTVSHPEIAQWWIGYDEAGLRREMLEDSGVTSFAIEFEREFIGAIMYHEELDPNYRYAMIDITVDADNVGRGLGTDALRTLARYLFERRGHHRIMIDPALSNARAIAAYKKVGFKPVGVMRKYERGPDGQWRDALLLDLLAEELR